jgi:hypothetical protein
LVCRRTFQQYRRLNSWIDAAVDLFSPVDDAESRTHWRPLRLALIIREFDRARTITGHHRRHRPPQRQSHRLVAFLTRGVGSTMVSVWATFPTTTVGFASQAADIAQTRSP